MFSYVVYFTLCHSDPQFPMIQSPICSCTAYFGTHIESTWVMKSQLLLRASAEFSSFSIAFFCTCMTSERDGNLKYGFRWGEKGATKRTNVVPEALFSGSAAEAAQRVRRSAYTFSSPGICKIVYLNTFGRTDQRSFLFSTCFLSSLFLYKGLKYKPDSYDLVKAWISPVLAGRNQVS